MTGRAPPPARAGRQEEHRGGKRVISEGHARGRGEPLVLNLEQLMKGIVSQIFPISSLLLLLQFLTQHF